MKLRRTAYRSLVVASLTSVLCLATNPVLAQSGDAAVEMLDKAIAAHPNEARLLVTRSSALLRAGKNDQALADADAALKYCQDDRAMYLGMRGACLYIMGRDEAAINDFKEILDKCPNASPETNLMAYANLSEMYFRTGKFDESLKAARQAIEIDPRGCGGAAYYWRAQSATAPKDSAAATEAAAKAAQLGYVDSGRKITDSATQTYPHMFDPVQKQFSHRIDTRHFAFFFNSDEKISADIAKFAEVFLADIDANLFKSAPNTMIAPVNVYMMPDKESQYKFLKEEMKYDNNVWGCCIPQRNALAFYTTSGFGTVGHIVFAWASQQQFKGADTFVGIDSFFEKLYGYQDDDKKAALYWGYQNPWRLEKVKDKIPALTLTDVVALAKDRTKDHQSEERLVAIFLYEKHKLKKYLELARSGERGGYGTTFEAAFEQPISAIEPQWHEYLVGLSKNLARLEQIPMSAFFFSKAEFDAFTGAHKELFVDLSKHRSDVEDDDAGTGSGPKGASGVLPTSWIRAGSHPDEYEMGLDKSITHGGGSSGYLKSITSKPDGFGTLMQMFRVGAYRGKKVELTAWTRTADLKDKDWAGLWMRVDGSDRAAGSLAFDNMQDRPIKGTTDWTKQTIVLNVPEDAVHIAVGILLSGGGTAWVDDFSFRILGPSTTPEAVKKAKHSYINDVPTDLDFES